MLSLLVSESRSVMFNYLQPHGLSMEFSMQEYWSGLPFPSPGDIPNPGIKPRSPALQADFLLSGLTGKPHSHQLVAVFLQANKYLHSQIQFSSVTQLCPTLRPHGLQHARPPCPSPTLGVYSNSCLLSQWCYPTISSSVIPFSSCLQSCPASGSFQMSQFFTSGSQREFQLQHQSFQWIFRIGFL